MKNDWYVAAIFCASVAVALWLNWFSKSFGLYRGISVLDDTETTLERIFYFIVFAFGYLAVAFAAMIPYCLPLCILKSSGGLPPFWLAALTTIVFYTLVGVAVDVILYCAQHFIVAPLARQESKEIERIKQLRGRGEI